MCGIAGYVGHDDPALLQAMGVSLAHRGPDDAGFYTAPGIGLAHRRLSVIDLKSGHQPMANEDETVWTVFNGEIYNFEDLRARLAARGHHFATTSDTEVIVHLYEAEGVDFVRQLRGMFALALWDTRHRRLVLARDRIGEKPLFYTVDRDRLFFGSEIKAILQHCPRRTVRSQAVCDFLAMGYVCAPRTFYEGVQKLAPGQLLVYEKGHVRLMSYWRRGDGYGDVIPFERAKQELSERLSETVKLCLKSDVEVGGFLSGGVDSSCLVALMRQHAARVETFAVGFAGAAVGYNELSYARRVAEAVGSTHHELILQAQSSVELLPRILWHYDEPHGEPTSVLVYLLCEFTRRFVKVAVGGTGGDEIFFGYPRFAGIRALEYYRRLPRALRRHLVERIVQQWPETSKGGTFANRARRFVQASNVPSPEAYLQWVSLLQRDTRMDLLSETTVAQAEDPAGEAALREYLCGDEERGLLDRAADLDVGGYLPEYQLCYMDRMSMAHGLEVRSPLCDYDLVDFVTSLPSSYRLKGGRSKHIFKEVAAQWIPGSIIRRRKRGFNSPIGEWVKGELRSFIETFLSKEHVQKSGLLDPEGVAALLGAHLSGRRNHALALWSLLALEAWYRMYIEDGVTNASSYSLQDMRGAAPPASFVSLPGVRPEGSSNDARPGGFPDGAPPGRSPVGSSSGARPNWSGNGTHPVSRKPVWTRITRKRLWEITPGPVRQLLRPGLHLLEPAWLLGREFRRHQAFVSEAQHWPAAQARAYQLAQLQRLCRLAYEKSAYYRRTFTECGFLPQDLQSLDDLTRLPTVDRRVVREEMVSMCAVPLQAAGVEMTSTGGTGGEPIWFPMPVHRSAIEYAYLVTSWHRVGFSLGTPLAVLRGKVVLPNRRGFHHEYDPLLRHHYYSTFHLNDDNMARYLEHMATIGPCFLHAYPSSVAALARFCRGAGIHPPSHIRGIIAESEAVYSEQRQMVERVFGCRYFSCYGQTEKLVLAVECEHTADYHVWPPYGYFELLDEEGQRVTMPGRRGEIVGTSFMNTVMPLIRYRTGDWATYVGDRCEACGREHTIIRDIRGHRTQEVLIAVDGSEVSWAALNMHDDTFLHVRQFQFHQEKPGKAVLRVVPAADFGEKDADRIHRNLGRKLDGRLVFTIERVENIQLSPRGKAVYVDQRIPQDRPDYAGKNLS